MGPRGVGKLLTVVVVDDGGGSGGERWWWVRSEWLLIIPQSLRKSKDDSIRRWVLFSTGWAGSVQLTNWVV